MGMMDSASSYRDLHPVRLTGNLIEVMVLKSGDRSVPVGGQFSTSINIFEWICARLVDDRGRTAEALWWHTGRDSTQGTGHGGHSPTPSKIAVTPIRRPTRPIFQAFWQKKISKINNTSAHPHGGVCDRG